MSNRLPYPEGQTLPSHPPVLPPSPSNPHGTQGLSRILQELRMAPQDPRREERLRVIARHLSLVHRCDSGGLGQVSILRTEVTDICSLLLRHFRHR